MAITRTAMVDDDGSGTTGTIINNAWKTELYNQIDGALGSGGNWVDVAFNAANFSAAGGGTWTVGPAAITANRYTIIGKTLHWRLYLSWFAGSNTVAGTVTSLRIASPGGLTMQNNQGTSIGYCIESGTGARIDVDLLSLTNAVDLAKRNGSAWAAGAPGLIFVVTLELA